ncbi:MAG: DUF393 domain-containing protein [Candidatus Omnitrophica bacterium]|nr:DUF393 domain-containing protein [Candidatus Omnitrophota bacterium]
MINWIFGGLFVALMVYKKLVQQEPWAIGITQLGTLVLGLVFLYVIVLRFKDVKKLWYDYFHTPGSPVNLAMVRILFYGFMFVTFNIQEVIWFSQFPKELQFAPRGMGWLLPHLPINETWAIVSGNLFRVFCFLAMIGLWTRISTVIVAILGFYVVGIPHFYGNVAHNHLAVWIMTLFAASRVGDFYSVDAVIAGFKKADKGDVSVPGHAVAYALPLRFIWIFIGICYFFPGFWKLWSAGTAYLLGDNLKYHMYYDWMGFDGWMPSIRVDQSPWLCRLASLAVIFFEMNFIFLMFIPGWRYFAVFEALLFHNLTWVTMNINFLGLQLSYLTFLNWEWFYKSIGQKILPEAITVLYDGSCSFCRRAIAFLRVFDILGRINYQDLNGFEISPALKAQGIKSEDLMYDMHALGQSRIWKGFAAYRQIALRIPLLWPVYPFLFLGPVQTIGNNIYRRVADSRTCKIMPKKTAVVPDLVPKENNRALIAVATFIIVGGLTFGIMKVGSAWPFACHPTFSEIAWDKFMTIECEVVFADSTVKVVRVPSLKLHTGSYRIAGLMSKLVNIKDPAVRDRKLLALWKVLVQSNPELAEGQTLRFYFVENYTEPEKRHLNPLKRTLAFETSIQ